MTFYSNEYLPTPCLSALCFFFLQLNNVPDDHDILLLYDHDCCTIYEVHSFVLVLFRSIFGSIIWENSPRCTAHKNTYACVHSSAQKCTAVLVRNSTVYLFAVVPLYCIIPQEGNSEPCCNWLVTRSFVP